MKLTVFVNKQLNAFNSNQLVISSLDFYVIEIWFEFC